jgi:hypothetical protein
LLDSPKLPATLAGTILADLQELTSRFDVAETLDFTERLTFLDIAVRVLTPRPIRDEFFRRLDNFGAAVKVDSNYVLRKGNAVYDRLVAAAATPGWQERRRALDQFEAEIETIADGVKDKFGPAVFDRSVRGDALADVLISLMLPATSAVIEAADRDETRLQMTRLAAALAIHRIEHGTYPDSLEALVPTVLPALPTPLYGAQAFLYERRGEGYVLYSVCRNEVDDGGDDLQQPIVDGEWLSPAEQQAFEPPEMDDSDLVIRVPLPPLPTVAELLESAANQVD